MSPLAAALGARRRGGAGGDARPASTARRRGSERCAGIGTRRGSKVADNDGRGVAAAAVPGHRGGPAARRSRHVATAGGQCYTPTLRNRARSPAPQFGALPGRRNAVRRWRLRRTTAVRLPPPRWLGGAAHVSRGAKRLRGQARRFGALRGRRNARRIGAAPNAGDIAGSRAAVVRRRGGAAAPRANRVQHHSCYAPAERAGIGAASNDGPARQ